MAVAGSKYSMCPHHAVLRLQSVPESDKAPYSFMQRIGFPYHVGYQHTIPALLAHHLPEVCLAFVYSHALLYTSHLDVLSAEFFQKEAPEGSIKFLSYNVMAFNMDKPHTKENPNEIIEYLQQSDADIICLQEYITGANLKKKEIDRALSAYPYKHFYKIANGINGLGCYSRYPILSATPVDYQSKANGSMVYVLKVKDDTLTIINNHLESNKLTLDDRTTYMEMIKEPEADKVKEGSKKLISKLADAVPIRAAQADTIARIIQNRKTPSIIVCGDFNTSPFSYAHRIIANGLHDAFTQSGCGFGVSYNKNGFYFRIDHILISPDLRSYQCTVDKSIKHSDHYPIWCYISKK